MKKGTEYEVCHEGQSYFFNRLLDARRFAHKHGAANVWRCELDADGKPIAVWVSPELSIHVAMIGERA